MVKAIDTLPDTPFTEKFLGNSVRILDSEVFPVNSFIEVGISVVSFDEEDEPEDRGMLYTYTEPNGTFGLYLCYIEQPASANNFTAITIRFSPRFFQCYPADTLTAGMPFQITKAHEQQFNVCAQSREQLQLLQKTGHPGKTLVKSLHLTEIAIHLFRRALENIAVPFTVCQVPACRFLAYEGEREKIAQAIQLLQDNPDRPHTIKELSRKVAMNECYLKKGFKTVTGKTIHEFQQEQRINKARHLLKTEGRSVTDVANILGYSSISHFSTAFKKFTGMKPCELLA